MKETFNRAEGGNSSELLWKEKRVDLWGMKTEVKMFSSKTRVLKIKCMLCFLKNTHFRNRRVWLPVCQMPKTMPTLFGHGEPEQELEIRVQSIALSTCCTFCENILLSWRSNKPSQSVLWGWVKGVLHELLFVFSSTWSCLFVNTFQIYLIPLQFEHLEWLQVENVFVV